MKIKHFGDICKISGYEVPIVNVVIGGSPCQDLSVAGKRAGLAGARSGLFMEQIRIIKEMREKDAKQGRTGTDVRPRFMVWENVPGAFSVNGGQISQQSSKKQSVSQNQKPPIFQYLAKDGLLPDASWETDGQLLGECSTLSIGEFPNAAVESRLSQILEVSPHPKYCLSPRACQGILNRAERRGKELPEMLKTALEMQAKHSESAPTNPTP